MTDADMERKHQEDLERLKNFRLIDDDFFTKCFEGERMSHLVSIQQISIMSLFGKLLGPVLQVSYWLLHYLY